MKVNQLLSIKISNTLDSVIWKYVVALPTCQKYQSMQCKARLIRLPQAIVLLVTNFELPVITNFVHVEFIANNTLLIIILSTGSLCLWYEF